MPRVGSRERVNGKGKGGDRSKKGVEEKKKKRSQKDIIRSRIGRRSCRLRDRIQNDVGVPPGIGTRHRKQSKYAYGCVRTVAMVLVAKVKVETTMKRSRLSEFSIVSNSRMLRSVVKITKMTAVNTSSSNGSARQIQKEIRDRNTIFGLRESGRKFYFPEGAKTVW